MSESDYINYLAHMLDESNREQSGISKETLTFQEFEKQARSALGEFRKAYGDDSTQNNTLSPYDQQFKLLNEDGLTVWEGNVYTVAESHGLDALGLYCVADKSNPNFGGDYYKFWTRVYDRMKVDGYQSPAKVKVVLPKSQPTMLKSRLRMRLRTDGTDTNYDETVYYGYVLNVKIDLHKMSKPVMTIKIAFEGWPYAGINK